MCRPNLITFAGFVPCMFSFLLTALYCPTLSEPVPQWLSALNFVCLWLYQTLDALDGKQARRTGTSSPLGELFDHGCDAVTTIFVALSVACTIRLGSTMVLFTVVMSMLVGFYTTQWEEFFTGTLVLGYVGVTEAQMTTLAIYLSGAIFGTDFYLWEVPLPVIGSVQINLLLVCAVFASGVGQVAYNCYTVYKMWSVGKASAYNALGYLIPVSSVVLASYAWVCIDSAVLEHHAHVFELMLGFLIANFVGRIIVYRVCGLDAAFFVEMLLPLFAGLVNAYFDNILFSTETAVNFTFVFYLIAYFHYAVSIIHQMTEYLHIKCFTIPVPNLASNPPVKPYGETPTPVTTATNQSHAQNSPVTDGARKNRGAMSPTGRRK